MFSWWQYCVPKRWLSRCFRVLAECEWLCVRYVLIKSFCSLYPINWQESAIKDWRLFKNFNDFFTRRLDSRIRPLPHKAQYIVSPVDGIINQMGRINDHRILQAKGKYFSLENLLGGDPALSLLCAHGSFMTLYLAPEHYHRIHMPCDGQLILMRYIPGKLFSVGPQSTRHINNLFARNERVVCVFKTSCGYCIVVAVGALLIGSISTIWHGLVGVQEKNITSWDYAHSSIFLNRGQELGHFQAGSTVIVLFSLNQIAWLADVQVGMNVRFGQAIASPFDCAHDAI